METWTDAQVSAVIDRISGHYIKQMREFGVEEDKIKKIIVAVIADELNWVVDNM